jgi:uncharacterized protein
MTAANANEQTIRAFYSAIESMDPERARVLMTEDASWAVMAKGFPDVSSDEGRDRAIEAFFVPVRATLKEGSIKFTIRSMISSGDFVMVEASVRGDGVKGDVYQNQYAYAFQLRDGRISVIREYADTLQASRFFGVEVPA